MNEYQESAIEALKTTVARLRAPGGCPWDQAQTHASITQLLIEECSEVIEAIENEDWDHLCEELGDLLLHILLHAQIATDNKNFTFDELAERVNAKVIRRHPHVFGDRKADTIDEVADNWEAIKAQEKPGYGQTLFKDLPPSIPSLVHAQSLIKRIHKKQLGDAPLDSDSIAHKTRTLTDEASVGQALFEIVAACQTSGIQPEEALRKYNRSIRKAYENAHATESTE